MVKKIPNLLFQGKKTLNNYNKKKYKVLHAQNWRKHATSWASLHGRQTTDICPHIKVSNGTQKNTLEHIIYRLVTANRIKDLKR